MRLVSFTDGRGTRVGVLLSNGLVDLPRALVAQGCQAPQWTYDMLCLIDEGATALEAIKPVLDTVSEQIPGRPGYLLETASVRLLAPIPRPRKNVFGVGLNYREHVREGADIVGRSAEPPAFPTFFTRSPTSVIGPEEPVRLDQSVTLELDYEAELGVIVGRNGIDLTPTAALDFVFGYTIVNDLSARDVQRRHGQWFKGKSLDGTCPIGPCIVTSDEVPDPQDLDISLRLNGITMQASNTRHMIFHVVDVLAQLSQGMTIETGDIIATGTPGGVGFTRKPPVFLREGDVLEVEIERIGVLRNTVRTVESRTDSLDG
jgi:2-keto-4-pentenoate hydratase/2-oxohepta-3-ene-1,7-dioic acid hydratase in catechol pathway